MTDISLATNVPFAVTAGVATFFSPCAYPLLPGYVGFYVNSVDADSASVLGAGSPRACGRGRCAGDVRAARWRHRPDRLLDAGKHHRLRDARRRIAHRFRATRGLRAHPVDPVPLPKRRTGVFGFGLFGAGYALAGAGCVAPVFLGVVARAIALPSETAVILLAVYAGTVAVLMAATTVATGVGLISNANRVMAHAGTLKRLAGAVMIVAGVGQLYLSLVVY